MVNSISCPCLNVAIASYDAREIRIKARYLEEQSAAIQCHGYRSGMELLGELLNGKSCDAIVLGGRLEDMDADEFITRLRRLEYKPPLLFHDEGRFGANAVSCLRADGRSYIVRRDGLKDIMRKLSDIPGRHLLRVESLCGRLYAEWGINVSDINCGYVTSALRIACSTDKKLALRKELLRQVSLEHNTSVAAVDSGIRRLIGELEEHHADGWLNFKRQYGFSDKRPTTGMLISSARDYLLTHGLT